MLEDVIASSLSLHGTNPSRADWVEEVHYVYFFFTDLATVPVMCHIRKEHFSHIVACLATLYFDWMKVGPVILNLKQFDGVVIRQRKWNLGRWCAQK